MRIEESFATDHCGDFDLVISASVLEHVVDPPALARAYAATLRPCGSRFAVTPQGRTT